MLTVQRDLESMQEQTYDVLVIGGGINGTAAAKDAAVRGLKTALVEKEDFGYGTSSRSTRLIHGGLRYLEMFDFGLVREGLRERELLFRHAPHLVHPLEFLTPVYEENRHNRLTVKIGMILYDLLSWDKSVPNHKSYSPAEVMHLEPHLQPDGLTAGMMYYDGQCEFPERLCVENVLSAVQHGADAANHAEVTSLDLTGTTKRVEILDGLSGNRCTLQSRVVVNAAGPWVDELNHDLVSTNMRTRIRKTKGVHLVVPKFTDHAIVVLAQRDGRVFFVIPWRGYSLVGTTDTDFEADLDHVDATREDIRYLVSETARVFPGADLRQIHLVTSGVRALVRKSGNVSESAVSRKHAIFDHSAEGQDGLISVLGGKITGQRLVGKDAIDAVCKRLAVSTQSRTHRMPYFGGDIADMDEMIEQISSRGVAFGLSRQQARELVSTYGSKAGDVLEYCNADRDLADPIQKGRPEIWAQLQYGIDREMVRSTSDFLMRRVAAGLSPGLGQDMAPPVAEFIGDRLGWDAAQVRADVAGYNRFVSLMQADSDLVESA